MSATDGKLKGLKIVSDGTVEGTRVYSADGEDLTKKLKIRGIRWSHNTGGIPTAELTCSLSAIEADNVDGELDENIVVDVSHLGQKTREYARKEDLPQ